MCFISGAPRKAQLAMVRFPCIRESHRVRVRLAASRCRSYFRIRELLRSKVGRVSQLPAKTALCCYARSRQKYIHSLLREYEMILISRFWRSSIRVSSLFLIFYPVKNSQSQRYSPVNSVVKELLRWFGCVLWGTRNAISSAARRNGS